MPLRSKSYSHSECQGFFNGVLPEEAQRNAIARNLGISAENDFALLEFIGGECAGAITFVPSGASLPNQAHDYRALSEEELAVVLRQLPDRPLLAGEDGVRLSLAGAQSKLAVHVSDSVISIPLGSAPSTHILKPASTHFEGLIDNEALCLNLARKVGLEVARVELGQVAEFEFLLIERYDRLKVTPQANRMSVQRLHQEDFCQALGTRSMQKYEIEGGPSLQKCFELLRNVSAAPVLDLRELLDAVIFNFLIGNHDAHGKNFSLLYTRSENGAPQTRLAPLYDLVSTVSYKQLSKKLAMRIGNEYDSAKIMPRHFERLSEEAGLSKRMAVSRVPELATAILESAPEVVRDFPQAAKVATLIEKRATRALKMFS